MTERPRPPQTTEERGGEPHLRLPHGSRELLATRLGGGAAGRRRRLGFCASGADARRSPPAPNPQPTPRNIKYTNRKSGHLQIQRNVHEVLYFSSYSNKSASTTSWLNKVKKMVHMWFFKKKNMINPQSVHLIHNSLQNCVIDTWAFGTFSLQGMERRYLPRWSTIFRSKDNVHMEIKNVIRWS
jgi:hypothetical protein